MLIFLIILPQTTGFNLKFN